MNRRFLLLAASFTALFASTSSVRAEIEPTGVSGDLTVTVEELADGGMRFTLSGSAPVKSTGSVNRTPWVYDEEIARYIPPSTLDESREFFLPEGVSLQVPLLPSSLPEDGPEDLGPEPLMYDVDDLRLEFASGGWYLRFSSEFLDDSVTEPVRGTGSVVIPPGSLFAGVGMGSQPEDAPEEGDFLPESEALKFSDFVPGTFPIQGNRFDITYVVVPFSEVQPISTPTPAITLRGPGRYPALFVGRGARVQVARIRNTGDAPLRGLRAIVVGGGSRDFRASQPAPRQLAPGRMATSRVVFRPRRVGLRRARLIVRGNAPQATAHLVGQGRRMGLAGPLRPFR